jgi:hypothetical protein
VALSQLKALGEQAVIAVAASLARGGPIIRGQLIASHFYEALRYELKQSPMHDTQRAALMAASDRCERIAEEIGMGPRLPARQKKLPSRGGWFRPSCELKTCTPATRSAWASGPFFGANCTSRFSARCRDNAYG